MRYDSIVVVVLSSQFCMKRPDLLSGLSFFTSRFNLLIANNRDGGHIIFQPVGPCCRAAIIPGDAAPKDREQAAPTYHCIFKCRLWHGVVPPASPVRAGGGSCEGTARPE